MDNVLAIKKGVVNFLCCFVPRKRWRKKIKRILVDNERRRKELLAYGCTINGETITTPQGVIIDISDEPNCPLYLVKEVFIKDEYKLNLERDSILIDIGMNVAAASLLFATNKYIKKIYSYEPFKPTFEKAKKNLRLNPELSRKIVPRNFGLGSKEKVLKLPYMITATGGMSTTQDVCSWEKHATTETVIVKDALQEFAAILEENKGKHVIVKCDCEGAELEIFKRLNEGNMVRGIDVVIMEYHFGKYDELVRILTANSFALQVKSGSKKSRTGYIYAVRMAERTGPHQ